MKTIRVIYNTGNSRDVNFNQIPDECPICHYAIDPVDYFAYCDEKKWNSSKCMQIVYRCTKEKCSNLFIAYYAPFDSLCKNFKLLYTLPYEIKEEKFSEIIKNVSKSFCNIFNQAHSAEQFQLNEICGCGYRKALEFLIKDYLINKNSDKTKEIKEKFLGSCITEYIVNDNIKEIAKRAVWLGNDETHYNRKWEKKDVEDLKILIKLTVNWIEMETMTKIAIEDMPEN